MGLTRMERWERADKMALQPPLDVYKILTTCDEKGQWQGLTLVHFFSQLEPCLTHKTPYKS